MIAPPVPRESTAPPPDAYANLYPKILKINHNLTEISSAQGVFESTKKWKTVCSRHLLRKKRSIRRRKSFMIGFQTGNRILPFASI